MQLCKSTVLIPPDSRSYSMSSIVEVKMINEGDNVRLVVPRSYFQQLGFERGDTLLVTIEEERAKARKKQSKAHAQKQHRHN
jgi:antitoxin component of MazEF toxin-antitoxin module